MARLIGTGTAPGGMYPAGQEFDLPAYDPDFDRLLSKGWAALAPEDPGATIMSVAHSVVRGEELRNPVEKAIATSIAGRELAIVNANDPDAEPGATGQVTKPEPIGGEADRNALDASYGLGAPFVAQDNPAPALAETAPPADEADEVDEVDEAEEAEEEPAAVEEAEEKPKATRSRKAG